MTTSRLSDSGAASGGLNARRADGLTPAPVLAAALARDNTETAVTHAQALLPAPQQPPPEQLASLLTSGIDAWDQGRREAATRDLRAAVEVAQDLVYL